MYHTRLNLYNLDRMWSLMIPGFDKIVEQRIETARRKGMFDNLPGAGKPIVFENDAHIAQELRMSYKILKNADCIPPEIELKKEILQTEELLADMEDTTEKYKLIKKLNFQIMKLNTIRNSSAKYEMPQKYLDIMLQRLESEPSNSKTEQEDFSQKQR